MGGMSPEPGRAGEEHAVDNRVRWEFASCIKIPVEVIDFGFMSSRPEESVRDLVIPQSVCACCLSKPSHCYETTWSFYRSGAMRRQNSYSLQIPLCSSCAEHRDQFNQGVWSLFGVPAILGGLVGVAVYLAEIAGSALGGWPNFFAAVVVAFLVAIPSFVIWQRVRGRAERLSDNCARRGSPVQAQKGPNGAHLLVWNPNFASLLIEANGPKSALGSPEVLDDAHAEVRRRESIAVYPLVGDTLIFLFMVVAGVTALLCFLAIR